METCSQGNWTYVLFVHQDDLIDSVLKTPLQPFLSRHTMLLSIVQHDKNCCEEYHLKLEWTEFWNGEIESWASIFDIDHSRGFWETIYFSRKITITICTYSERTDQQHCMHNSIKVKFKFVGDKKGPTKGFYLEVWKIDSIFFIKSIFWTLKIVFIFEA